MTTTTPTEILERIVANLEALQPNVAPLDRPFRRSRAPNREPLRRWARDHGTASMLRLFEARVDGEWRRLGIEDPQANFVAVPLLVTVAYPAKPTLYEWHEFSEIEAMITSDAIQIADEIRHPTSLLEGHEASDCDIGRLDQGDEDVWFQSFPITALFYVRQR